MRDKLWRRSSQSGQPPLPSPAPLQPSGGAELPPPGGGRAPLPLPPGHGGLPPMRNGAAGRCPDSRCRSSVLESCLNLPALARVTQVTKRAALAF